MSKTYEVEITETRTTITTTKVMVDADSWMEARARALRGEATLTGEPQVLEGEPELKATDHAAIGSGASLSRVAAFLDKPEAFTIHARLWTSRGLGARREYAVVNMDPKNGMPGITLQEFPDGRILSVAENEIHGIRIESEGGEISYSVTNIRYDTDGETAIVDLPDELEIDLPADTDEDDVEERIGDAISERTGWCHKGFDYELAA